MPHTILAVHGIFDNGDWHQRLARAVWPHFDCASIRYRDYHAFGFVNIFFWPWSILFAGLLGWLGAQQPSVSTEYVGVAVALMLGCGFVAAFRSGIGRTLPWLWIGAFWLGPTGQWQTLLPIVAASLVISGVGWYFTKSDRRSAPFWLAGLLVTVAAWGAGWLLSFAGPTAVLAGCGALLGLYLARSEFHWNGWNLQVVWPAVIGVGGAVLPYLAPAIGAVPLVLLMLFLELEERRGDQRIEAAWLAIVSLVAAAIPVVWAYTSADPWLAFTGAGGLLFLGLMEPPRRMQRAVARVVAQVDRICEENPYSGKSLMAHSLGAFTSAQAFDQCHVELDRVLFLGGAVTESYLWDPLISGSDPIIEDVRNEHGSFDLVIKMLWMAGSWATRQGLGGAGWVGFQPQPPTVAHQVANPHYACTQCPEVPPVRLHNYSFKGYRHSTFLLRRYHLVEYWLPYFWGHSPQDVRGFRKWCLRLREALQEKPQNKNKIKTLVQKFRKRSWNWYSAGRATFARLVRDEVGPKMKYLDRQYPELSVPPSREVLYRAVCIVSELVAQALYERGLQERSQSNLNEDRLAFLNPPLAIAKASRQACDEVTRNLRDGWRP